MELHPKKKNRNHDKDPQAVQPKCITHISILTVTAVQRGNPKLKVSASHVEADKFQELWGRNISIKPFFGRYEEH